MSDEAEKAWEEYAVGGEHGPGPVTYRGAFMAGRASVQPPYRPTKQERAALVRREQTRPTDEAVHGSWDKEDQRYVDGCEPGDEHSDPWEGFTGESPEDAAYAEGWKDAREHDNFSALRDRIVALEAVIAGARDELGRASVPYVERTGTAERLLSLAPSVVLDGMIREAKAEAVEAARDAIMPPVNWNLRPDGTEMPGTQHIDEALHDIHVQLSAVAAEYRNEER